MTKVLNEVLAANERYADNFGDKSALPIPPGRRFAILTCMDARLDPAKFAGLAEGDAHVIRNAGGRASDDWGPASSTEASARARAGATRCRQDRYHPHQPRPGRAPGPGQGPVIRSYAFLLLPIMQTSVPPKTAIL
jgi:hypothetical protein